MTLPRRIERLERSPVLRPALPRSRVIFLQEVEPGEPASVAQCWNGAALEIRHARGTTPTLPDGGPHTLIDGPVLDV